MVHINRVATTKEVDAEKNQFELAPESTSGINLTPEDDADDFTATVYGSKYAMEDLPRHEMPVSAGKNMTMAGNELTKAAVGTRDARSGVRIAKLLNY